ncbi:MAG TPA: ComGF family competence protein [Pseudogracilibacillus sp.]|nr:ComGF family competence protein [Pseudogracilibacillus sp.]
MKIIEQIKFVYMPYWTNNNGFTYVSVLLSFLIIFTTLPILVYFLSILDESPEASSVSVQQFFHIIQKNQYDALSIHIHEDRIYYERLKEGREEQVVMEQYESTVRQKVGERGHEIYLREVESFSVQEEKNYFMITLKLLNGETYEKTFTLPS